MDLELFFSAQINEPPCIFSPQAGPRPDHERAPEQPAQRTGGGPAPAPCQPEEGARPAQLPGAPQDRQARDGGGQEVFSEFISGYGGGAVLSSQVV